MEPGYLLIVTAMNWAMFNGLTRYDFMRGDEPYKTRWNATPVPLVKLQFVLTSNLRARIRDQYLQSRALFKSGLRICQAPFSRT